MPPPPLFKEFASLKRPAVVGAHWVYALEFWPSLTPPPYVFAAVGGRRVTICELDPSLCASPIQVMRAFCDEDEKEDFYACAFTIAPADNAAALLCVAGEAGTIKILHLESGSLYSLLMGHGGPVYDMKTHGSKPDVLFSCSKDESVRMWEISTRRCLAVFAGDEGHRDSVLSISLHSNLQWLASCGLDNSIRVWELDTEVILSAMQPPVDGNKQQHRVRFVQFPAFCTRRAHTDYVDCIDWVGDLLVSKSTEGHCSLWKPDVRRRKNAIVECEQYEFLHGKQWFAKFAVNGNGTQLAVGAADGAMWIFALPPNVGTTTPTATTSAAAAAGPQVVRCLPAVAKQIRACAFSPDGEFLLFAGDDGIVTCLQQQQQ